MEACFLGKQGMICRATPNLGNNSGTGAPMIVSETPALQKQLENRILARTGKRVRNLEIQFSPNEVILLGDTSTYHVKQLAQHGVLDVMPTIRLYNRITVR
jgi:hypothetical protein